MKNEYILMLEQDAVDRETTMQHINSAGKKIDIEFVSNSADVIRFLNNKTALNQKLPRVVLLSMNSFPQNGLIVLKTIRSVETFKYIPVIILGENTLPELVLECYAAGANSFINKPLENSLTDIKIKTFLSYWFDVVEIPVKNITTDYSVS